MFNLASWPGKIVGTAGWCRQRLTFDQDPHGLRISRHWPRPRTAEQLIGAEIGARRQVMPLSDQHRHAVLLADRTRDVRTFTTVVTEVLAANPETTPLDIESALRAAFRQAYLVAHPRRFRDCARYAGLACRAR